MHLPQPARLPGGAGCALHRAALARGQAPLELKPDVCWQLPLRREDTTDDAGRVTSTITQWDRRHWGDGGAEFHWWCTEAPEAFTGAEPVYESLAAELVAMVGRTTYARWSPTWKPGNPPGSRSRTRCIRAGR